MRLQLFWREGIEVALESWIIINSSSWACWGRSDSTLGTFVEVHFNPGSGWTAMFSYEIIQASRFYTDSALQESGGWRSQSWKWVGQDLRWLEKTFIKYKVEWNRLERSIPFTRYKEIWGGGNSPNLGKCVYTHTQSHTCVHSTEAIITGLFYCKCCQRCTTVWVFAFGNHSSFYFFGIVENIAIDSAFNGGCYFITVSYSSGRRNFSKHKS